MTSLTLLLIYLNNLQITRGTDQVPINELICSTHYGKQSFNRNVDEWVECLETLFANQVFDETDKSSSVQNIIQRYNDLKELLPDDVTDNALPYFIDWLTENGHLVEITAYSDQGFAKVKATKQAPHLTTWDTMVTHLPHLHG